MEILQTSICKRNHLNELRLLGDSIMEIMCIFLISETPEEDLILFKLFCAHIVKKRPCEVTCKSSRDYTEYPRTKTVLLYFI